LDVIVVSGNDEDQQEDEQENAEITFPALVLKILQKKVYSAHFRFWKANVKRIQKAAA
jgi:hypothetical protein